MRATLPIHDSVTIVPGLGLVPLDAVLDHEQLRRIGNISIEEDNQDYSLPLLRDARLLNEHAGAACQFVLLGSIATHKYTKPLLDVFG